MHTSCTYSWVFFVAGTALTLHASAPSARAEESAKIDSGVRAENWEGDPSASKEDRSTIYSPVGKRDPFRAPPVGNAARDLNSIRPLERYSLEQLQLKAVLKGLGKAKAMFEDADGNTHILQEGDTLGREQATISRIVNSEVIVTQKTFNYLGSETLLEKVISLPKEPDFDAVLPPGQKGPMPSGRMGDAIPGGAATGAVSGVPAGAAPVSASAVSGPSAAKAANGGVSPSAGWGVPVMGESLQNSGLITNQGSKP